MSNKTYDRLKWFALIGMPVFKTVADYLAKVDYKWASNLALAFSCLSVCLGLILKVLSDNYHKQEEGE